MKKILLLLIFTTALTITHLFGQTKMIVGQKHTIFVDIPSNWLQAQNEQLPFFIKPNEKEVSSKTYMYVYGIDYEINPKIEGWIDGNNKDAIENNEVINIDSLNLKLDNIKADDYLTGKYRILTYEYKDKRKEAILVIECKNTIATIVLSTKDKVEFEKFKKSFMEIAKTFRFLGTTLKKE